MRTKWLTFHDRKWLTLKRPLTTRKRVVEIYVTDTGIGLKKEDIKRIFNPFEQVDGSKSRRYGGTGLGLSLSKKFVELHHGDIGVESKGENQGSIFHVVIPI